MAEAAGPLPRGRHGLSRHQVAATQRARMLLAMADAMAEQGYVDTSVADVLRRAGVSRETFYQQFRSKQDGFLAAFDAAGAILVERLEAAVDPARPGLDQIEDLLGVYLDTLAEEPGPARIFLIEVYAAGPEALRRRAELQQRLVDRVADLLGARTVDQRFACEALVAAVSSLVTTRLAAGDLDGLRALRGPVATLVRQVAPALRER